MNEFYLFFWGLICHIGPESNRDVKTHAALAKGTDHERYLVFPDLREVPLNSNLTFSGTPGFAVPDEDFAAVPSLRDLAGDDVVDEVRTAQPIADIAFHALYPGDANVRLGVANVYPKLGQHHRDGASTDPRVIPRITYARITTSQTQLPLQFDGSGSGDILTEQNPCVLIANVERRPNSINDFEEYKSILKNAASAGQMIDLSEHGFQLPFPRRCNWVRRYVADKGRRESVKAALSTECGNTQWP